MKRTIGLLAAIVLCLAGSVYALYEVNDRGDWPKSWPAELESLRAQARTLVGPMAPNTASSRRFCTQYAPGAQ